MDKTIFVGKHCKEVGVAGPGFVASGTITINVYPCIDSFNYEVIRTYPNPARVVGPAGAYDTAREAWNCAFAAQAGLLILNP